MLLTTSNLVIKASDNPFAIVGKFGFVSINPFPPLVKPVIKKLFALSTVIPLMSQPNLLPNCEAQSNEPDVDNLTITPSP